MVIYKTTNLLNGKIYIGQDSANRKFYMGSGNAISNALKKYGKENFKKEILCHCTSKQELDEKEIFYIKLYNSTNRKIGYNISEGGKGALGVKLTEKRKQIISNANKGKIMSPETRKKISIAHTGRIFSEKHKQKISSNHHNVSGKNNPMFGKTHTEKTKKFLKKINLGRKPTAEQIQKMKLKSSGENNANSKLKKEQVLEIRKIYDKNLYSLNQLAKMFNVKLACIHKVITRKTWKKI